MEETFWKQNAASKFLCDGEKNIKYFNSLVNKNSNINHIHKFKSKKEELCEDQKELVYFVIDYFKKAFNKEGNVNYIRYPNYIPSIISIIDNDSLLVIPYIKEIKEILKDMNMDFVASSNGFYTIFLKTYWDIIKY